MLNETAKKLVAREARNAARQARDRISLGANMDDLVVEAWRDAQRSNPDFRNWPSAERYFESVFCNEVQ